jgi:uncharacterized protein (DUF2141 family)
VFSTGNYIDSLTLSGKVKGAFDMKTEKGILVMLYDSFDDSVPYKKHPSYFSKTNSDGTYRINHIHPGTYKVFVLKDANGNYLYDIPGEQIAFSDTFITIRQNAVLDFLLFSEEPAKQKLKKTYVAGHGHLAFVFAKPADSIKLQFLSPEPKQNVIYEYSQNKDTLHYWFADDIQDTIKIKIINGNEVLDMVRLRPITLEQATKGIRGDKWALKVNVNVSNNQLHDVNKNIVLQFNHPLDPKRFRDSIVNLSDKHTSFSLKWVNERVVLIQPQNNKKEIGSGNENFSTVFSPVKWRENATYHLLIPPRTFTDIFGLTNDTIKLNFKTQEEKYYGTLKLMLKMKYNIAYILQLMNEKGEIFNYTSSDKGIFTYAYLPPGSYKLRIIYDKNRDGKWTTGNYLQERQPEKVIYYPNPLIIRSDWDTELEWKVE